MTATVVKVHKPTYTYCMDPETCCYSYGPIAINCAADGEPWPCETKRSHHTHAYGERLARWVQARKDRGHREY